MSQNPPRENGGRSPVRKHVVSTVGTEAPGFFNPPMPKSKRQRGALQAATANARAKRRTQNDG